MAGKEDREDDVQIRIVDLCSGAGGPIPRIENKIK
jgi:hypothetical protein